MKLETIYCDKEEVLRVVTMEVPKKPEFKGDYFLHYGPQKQYEESLQACKDSSVPFEDQDTPKKWLWFNEHGLLSCCNTRRRCLDNFNACVGVLKQDTFYTVPAFECEIVTVMSEGWQPTYNNPDNSGCEQPAEPIQVARLSPSEPVKDKPEMPEEFEKMFDWAKCGIYHNHAHNEEKLEANLLILEKCRKRIEELESKLK